MKDKVKKALKRVASGLMAAIFAVCLVGTPRVKAVAVVDDVALGAMSCEAFLASIGLPLTATGGSSAVTAGVTAAAGEYAAATGAAASGEAFLGTVAAGTAVSTAGAIVLTAAAAVALGAFAYWLYDTYLTDTGSGSVPLYTRSGYFLSDGSVLPVLADKPYGVYSLTDYPFLKDGVTYTLSNGVTFCAADGYLTTSTGYSQKCVSDYYLFTSAGGVWRFDTVDTERVKYSGLTTGSFFDHIGDAIDESLSIDIDDFRPIPEEELSPTKQMVIDVGAAPGTTLSDLAQTVPDAIANGQFSPTYVIQVAPSVGPVPVPEVNPNPDVEAPADIAPYTVGLGEVFPFCIPFDIYHMVTMFAAEPEAPAATWEFTLPWSGQECEVSWSLEEWDEVAKLCRSLELVLFCVGLAVATYKMIKW